MGGSVPGRATALMVKVHPCETTLELSMLTLVSRSAFWAGEFDWQERSTSATNGRARFDASASIGNLCGRVAGAASLLRKVVVRLHQLEARRLDRALPQQEGVARPVDDHDAIARLGELEQARADEEVAPVPGGRQLRPGLL